jgi:hypothetical protein
MDLNRRFATILHEYYAPKTPRRASVTKWFSNEPSPTKGISTVWGSSTL